jgi:hypothetical protein
VIFFFWVWLQHLSKICWDFWFIELSAQ